VTGSSAVSTKVTPASSADEGYGVTDERDELGQDGEQQGAVVPDGEVGGHVPLQRWLAASGRGAHGERQQLADRHLHDAAAADVVPEAVRRQEPLEVLLVRGGGRQGGDMVGNSCSWFCRAVSLMAML